MLSCISMKFIKYNIDCFHKKYSLNDVLTDEYEAENWYRVRLRFTGEKCEYEVVNIELINWRNPDNQFQKLH